MLAVSTIATLMAQIATAPLPAGNALVVHRHGRAGIHLHMVAQSESARFAARSTRYGHRAASENAGVEEAAVILAVVSGASISQPPESNSARSVVEDRSSSPTPLTEHCAEAADRSNRVHPQANASNCTFASAVESLLERNHSLLI